MPSQIFKRKKIMPGLKKGQKIRVIVRDIQIYSTVGQYQNVFASGMITDGIAYILGILEQTGDTGMVTRYRDIQLQVDLL